MIPASEPQRSFRSAPAGLAGLLSLLVACSGGAGGADGPQGSSSPQGRFVDSAVEGLSFQGAGVAGTTDARGTFGYRSGEPVTFSVAGIPLGSAEGRTVVSPLDLVSGEVRTDDPRVVNLARFLQSLDENLQPDDGIRIPEVVRTLDLGFELDFDQSPEAFASDATVQQALAALGIATLVPPVEAREHLDRSLLAELVGTYTGTYGGSDRGTFRFFLDHDGVLMGCGRSQLSSLEPPFAFTGLVASHGEVLFGDVSGGARFEGRLVERRITGDWSSDLGPDAGSFAGSAPSEAARLDRALMDRVAGDYAGSFSLGGPGPETLTFRIEPSGAVVLTLSSFVGVAAIVATDETGARLEGLVGGTVELIGDVSTDGSVTGTARSLHDGLSGTFVGSRVTGAAGTWRVPASASDRTLASYRAPDGSTLSFLGLKDAAGTPTAMQAMVVSRPTETLEFLFDELQRIREILVHGSDRTTLDARYEFEYLEADQVRVRASLPEDGLTIETIVSAPGRSPFEGSRAAFSPAPSTSPRSPAGGSAPIFIEVSEERAPLMDDDPVAVVEVTAHPWSRQSGFLGDPIELACSKIAPGLYRCDLPLAATDPPRDLAAICEAIESFARTACDALAFLQPVRGPVCDALRLLARGLPPPWSLAFSRLLSGCERWIETGQDVCDVLFPIEGGPNVFDLWEVLDPPGADGFLLITVARGRLPHQIAAGGLFHSASSPSSELALVLPGDYVEQVSVGTGSTLGQLNPLPPDRPYEFRLDYVDLPIGSEVVITRFAPDYTGGPFDEVSTITTNFSGTLTGTFSGGPAESMDLVFVLIGPSTPGFRPQVHLSRVRFAESRDGASERGAIAAAHRVAPEEVQR